MASPTLQAVGHRYLSRHQSPRAFIRFTMVSHRAHQYRLTARRAAVFGSLLGTYGLYDYLKSHSVQQTPHWFRVLPERTPGVTWVRDMASRKIFRAQPIAVPPGTILRGFFHLTPSTVLPSPETLRVVWDRPAMTPQLIRAFLARYYPDLALVRVARQPGVATVMQLTGPKSVFRRLLHSASYAHPWTVFYQHHLHERFVVLHTDDPLDVQMARAFGCAAGKVWEIHPGVWTVATHKAPDPALVAVVSRALNVLIRI